MLCWTNRGIGRGRLRHRGDGVVRGAHLSEDLVQPLQRAVEMDLYPAGRGGDVLPVVLRPPALHERHPYSAHLGQLVYGFEAVIDAL